MTTLVDEIVSRGIADDLLRGINQGWRMQPAIIGTERKLKNGRLWHCGSSLMAWVAGNAKLEQRGNAMVIRTGPRPLP